MKNETLTLWYTLERFSEHIFYLFEIRMIGKVVADDFPIEEVNDRR